MKHVKIELGDTLEISGHVFMVTGYEFDGGAQRRGQLITGYVEKIEPERIPFDLEAAKRGEPLVTREGRKATLVAFRPEAKAFPFAAYIEGCESLHTFNIKGEFGKGLTARGNRHDLFMAPKPKRTVWVNTRKSGLVGRGDAAWFTSEQAAKADARQFNDCIAVAVPAEIEV